VVSETTTTPTTTAPSAEDYLAQGDTALGQGYYEQAIAFYNKGIQVLMPNKDALETELSLYTNLGTALSTMGNDQAAVRQYEKALQSYQTNIEDIVEPNHQIDSTAIVAQAAFFLGMVYQDMGQAHDAVDAYRLAFQFDPLHWAAVANLGGVLHDSLSRHRDALQAYNQAYTILRDPTQTPTDPPAEPRYILSQLQYRIGLCITHDDHQRCSLTDDPTTKPVNCKELAAHAFALAVEYDESNESARHMLATVTADATMTRASNNYVQQLFDDYAGNFEHSLVQELGYTGYERLRSGFDQAFEASQEERFPTFGKTVDAGCGTGLVGEQFRNITDYLIGVDLSEAIIAEAVKLRPHLYDEVIAGDVTQVFVHQAPLDLIVAADSYIYFGDLDPLFTAMQKGLRMGGYAAFTMENVHAATEVSLQESKPDWRWQLTASGRFAHRKEYVVDVGRRHGFRVIYYQAMNDFRYEKGQGVRGHLFVLQRVEDGEGSTSSEEL
jgi:predicted TPR repeat methyltransferase